MFKSLPASGGKTLFIYALTLIFASAYAVPMTIGKRL